jgi:CheY-like chemotaxis protein
MHAILLTADLMLISAAQGAADRHDAELTVAPNAAAVSDAMRRRPAQLVLIDLRTPGLDIHELVPTVRDLASDASIVACGPHVHEASLAKAAAAGCDEVITRGEFERRLDATLMRLQKETRT